VSDWEVVLLGAIAGFTIFLGLPLGRVRDPAPGLRSFLNSVAVGILLFLLWDVLSAGIEPVETSIVDATKHDGSWWRVIGLMSLVHYDRWMAGRRTRTPAIKFGPRAASAEELTGARPSR